ncbi:hypothetical protein ACL2XP_07920 [Sodalis sp. RH21]|uniref:hypothetical protein n=1 Tax=unclassified Sodalis (in: enterobacteria) TaxID=2636512 RepID=UPI0039B5C212
MNIKYGARFFIINRRHVITFRKILRHATGVAISAVVGDLTATAIPADIELSVLFAVAEKYPSAGLNI